MGSGDFRDFHYSAGDGLRLHARIYGGRADRLAVVCLPGLTRNCRDFHALALFLSGRQGRSVVAFDYRGRGGSEYDRNWRNYDVQTEAGDVIAGLTALGIEHAAFIGTSRGGLIVMALAAMRPALLRAAVLNDVGPVIEGEGLAQIRAYLDRAPQPKDLGEAIALQKAANGAAFPSLTDADWERMTLAIFREEGGRLIADFDPNLLKTLNNIDLGRPLPVLWPQFLGLRGIPVLAIRGANSRLLSKETLAEMARQHPGLETLTAHGQGHAPLLETPPLPEKIEAFIARAERQPAGSA